MPSLVCALNDCGEREKFVHDVYSKFQRKVELMYTMLNASDCLFVCQTV